MIIGIGLVFFLPDQHFVLSLLLAVIIGIGIYSKTWGYGVYILCVTIITILMMCLLFPGDWFIAITRLNMTLIGLVIALIASFFILPVKASNLLPNEIVKAKIVLGEYLEQLCVILPKNSGCMLHQNPEFKALLKLQRIFHDACQEIGNKPTILYQGKINHLLNIYETLQAFVLYYPDTKPPKSIESILNDLFKMLPYLHELFIQYDQYLVLRLQNQLADLYKQVYILRAKAAADLTIESTTLSHHITLILFIKVIQTLLAQIEQL